MALNFLFRKLGFAKGSIHLARNGLEAYQSAQVTNFDLIMMDLNMPVMNGFEACKKIKMSFTEQSLFQPSS